MSLMPWRPLRELSKDMLELFEHNPLQYLDLRPPRVDVYQTEEEVIITAEIPGVDKKDLDVYVDESTVKLAGQFRQSDEFRDEHVYRSERRYGSFSRSIPLPTEVKSDKAKAEYKDGVLSITIPKKEPGRLNGRRIQIQ
ncbi:MAG: Hsp20/alpha crystallin family protein [Firmicutes bacterium]|nr:Hsp20/alpha crystallin family protein [Bacillota bacterium]